MTQTAPTESGAARLLHDINIQFNIEKPDPDRVLFAAFQPYYAKFRHLALADALIEAYRSLSDAAEIQTVRRDALDALARCADQPLGVARSLVIIEFAHAVAAAEFEQSLWHRLFFRYKGLPQMPRWSGALLLRWSAWNVHVRFTAKERKSIVELVEPSRFECAVTYFFNNAPSEITGPLEVELQSLAKAAMTRLRVHSQSFVRDEIDTTHLEDVLNKLCDGVETHTTSEDEERRAVKENLSKNRREVDDPIGFGDGNTDADATDRYAEPTV
jgi:hypothetical protein